MSVLTHPVSIDPLIAEAKQRARRRRLLLLLAAGLAAASAAGIELSGSGSSGSSGIVPWLPTKPNIGPAHPPLAPSCTARQLGASGFFQAAAGSLAGSIDVANKSSHACALVGRPQLSFGAWPATSMHQPGGMSAPDPLVPPLGSLRALAPGRHASAFVLWGGICDGVSRSVNTPRGVVLTAPGGGTLSVTGVRFPSCNVPVGSTVGVTRYTPLVPQVGMFPLRAKIVPAAGEMLAARAGTWLDYTVVLTNISRRPFHFGRVCPPYEEQINALQAYLLNCHGVGPIAPHESVGFAMRVLVPRNPSGPAPALSWMLAPHSYRPPSSFAHIGIR